MAKLVGNGREREEIKIIVPITSDRTRNREFQKNKKKIPSIKKPRYGIFSSQNRLEKAKKERK